MNIGKIITSTALVTITGSGFLTPAFAQEQGSSDEIIVTAQRREQSAQDIPIAITAVTGEALASRGIQQPTDLARLTPGLSSVNATSGGTPIFAIRGIGLDDFNPNNNSGVAIYIDDIGISSPTLMSGQLFDVDRVEVLKGPQGTLYGRNATGGAVNIYSRLPTDKLEGYVNAGYGRWQTFDLNAALSVPVSDTVSIRASGSYKKAGEGWQTDIDTGQKYGKPDRLGLRFLVKIEPSSNFRAVLNLHLSRDRSILPSPQADRNEAVLGPISTGLVDTGTTDPSKVRVGDLRPHVRHDGKGATLNLVYDTAAFSVTSVTGYEHFDYRTVDNFDGMPGATFDFYQNDEIEQFYQELRVASKEGLWGGRIDWVVGASFAQDRIHGQDASDQSTPFVGLYLDPPSFFARGLSISQADYVQERKSWGLFGHTETHLTDSLSLQLGARYSHDRISFVGASTEQGSADGGVIFQGIGSIIESLDEAQSSENFSYRAGLSYHPNRNLLLYGSVSSAYKAGAYYASPALDPAAWGYVNPEKNTAYEIGFKSNWLDGALKLNGSLFDYEYKNRQSLVIFVSPVSGYPVGSLGNIPKARVRGFDLETIVSPVKGLELSGSIDHLDSKVIETLTDVRGAPMYIPVPVGYVLAQAPGWSYKIAGRFEQKLTEDLTARLQADYAWTGTQIAALSDPNAFYGPLKTLGGRLEIAMPGKGLTLAIWGRNLTDEGENSYSWTSFFGGRALYRQEPRSYGIELGYSF